MKKIFLSMLLLAATGSAFAQMTPEEKAALKAAQKEAKTQVNTGIKLRDEVLALYQANQTEHAKGEKTNHELIAKNQELIKEKSLEAHKLLTTALASGHVESKKLFEPNRALDDVSTQLLNPELGLAAQHETFDTLTFAKAVDGVCQGCYAQLEYGNPKDVIQKPYIEQAAQKMPKLQIYYAYLCMFYSETKNLDGAIDAYEKYANFGTNYPRVANEEEVKNPQYPVAQFAFNIYYTAYTLQRYDVCAKFYEQAMKFDDEGSHTFVQSSRPQIYLQQGDTAQWVASLEEMIDLDPTSNNADVATQNLLAYYGKKGVQEMSDFADKILAKNPQSKMANYGKGHSLFSAEKYEEALPYFQKTIELDPEFVEGYNMCGMSLYRQAALNYFEYIDGKKFKTSAELTKAENQYVKDYYRKALVYFETCREKAENESDMWAGPLQTIYRNLDQKDKAAEMDEYLK